MAKDLKGKELPPGIRQRANGSYEARAMINGIRISVSGSNLTKVKKDFFKRKEEIQNGLDVRRQKMTLNAWFEEWFTTYKVPMIKASSVFPMRSKFQNTFGKTIGDLPLGRIRNIDIQEAVNTLHSEGRANSSLRDALGRLRDCLESAKRNRIIPENPCFDIVVPWKTARTERRFLTEKEQQLFLEEASKTWYKEMFCIMFLTGMRIGEVGGLKWHDVDFEKECINISQSLSCQYENGVKTLQITTPKTYNSYRKIPFIGEAKEMFLAQKQKVESLRESLGPRFRGVNEFSDLVFVSSMGSPVTRYHAERECRKIVENINLAEALRSVQEQRAPNVFAPVYPHAIRHTFCSRCFERGMNPKIVQNLMGHQHYSTTIEIYTHVTEERMLDEVSKFGSLQCPSNPNDVPN